MPDMNPRPSAGAIRLSVMTADQKGTRSASVLAIVACIRVLTLTTGPRQKPILTPTSRRLHDRFDRNAEIAKKLKHRRSGPTEADVALGSTLSCRHIVPTDWRAACAATQPLSSRIQMDLERDQAATDAC